MRQYIISIMSALLLAVSPAGYSLSAQNSQEVLSRANQQYVLYESAKGDNSAEMYDHLYQSYTLYTSLLDAYSDPNAMEAARNRLTQIYPALMNAAMFFSNMNDTQMAHKFGMAYILLPRNQAFTGSGLTRDAVYPQIVYNTGISAYKLQKMDDAVICFNEYLTTGEADRAKDCIVFLNMIHMSRHNYVEQEKILQRAITEYPNTMDFYYNLINLYISTQNQQGLLATIDKVLAVDPNDVNVLPIKARMEEAAGNVEEALELYRRLLSFFPDDLAIMKGIAKCSFKIGSEINNQAYAVVDEAEGMELRQKAYPYLYDARIYFERILRKEPTSAVYMKGLEECYKFMDMTAEATVLLSLIAEGGSYASFDEELRKYRQLAMSVGMEDTVSTSAVLAGDPPLLTTLITGFTETNANKVIDAGESFSIEVSVRNSGLGDAHNVKLMLSENSGMDRFFEGTREIDAGIIKAGETQNFTFRYTLSETAPTAEANITVYTLEESGMDADPSSLIVNIQEMARPRLLIADHQYMSARGTSITLGDRGQLIVALQNVGRLPAKNTRITFECPTNIIATDEIEIAIDSIQPGEVVPLTFDFLVNKRFSLDSIPIGVKISEGSTFAIVQDVFKVKLGEYLSTANKIVIEGKLDERPSIDTDFSLAMQSELLENVPAGTQHPNRYALIIGNEDYHSHQRGLSTEADVLFAANDAAVFARYCEDVLGIPHDNIVLLIDAGRSEMNREINRMTEIVSLYGKKAELVFYYAGHGFPDKDGKESYLIPVDIPGTDYQSGFMLSDLYDRLASTGAGRVTVFMDACFSGGGRQAGLLAARGIKIVPKDTPLKGNIVVFSATSSDQVALPYNEKQHGMFTYFLLKKMQNTAGNCSYSELSEYLKTEVSEYSLRINYTYQNPETSCSYSIRDEWEEWNLINP